MKTPSSPLHILCFSHLAWERRLFQRPQQLATRFAAMGDKVAYFTLIGLRRYLDMKLEERTIAGGEGKPFAQNLPWFPLSRHLTLSRTLTVKLLEGKARPHLHRAPKGRRVLWFQHPSAYLTAGRIDHDLLVYDAMDPFSQFKQSESTILEAENLLLKKAGLVFTGGRSLHNAITGRRPDAHCFPSGIDFEHFARGADDGPLPKDLEGLPRPILGYFGAVDERIDWDFIRHLCRERRHWSIVFLGPLILMDDVPVREENFHWLGPKPYDLLPDYLRGFDVCLIPWIVNHLTRFMSPTKTPEYLAAGRPVVSTPIPDVVEDYREEVLVAESAEQYVEQCTRALNQGVGPARKPPQSRTWEETAAAMRELIEEKLASGE